MKAFNLLVAFVLIVQACLSVSVASIDETSTDSTRTEHEHNDERVLDQDQDQGHEENPTHPKVWNEIFEILYKPTPDINKDSLRRFTKTVKSVHSLESTSSVIDAALQVTNMQIQGSSCEPVAIDLRDHLNLNEKNGIGLLQTFHKSLTQPEWEHLEKQLTKELTPYQLKRALKILRPLHKDSTEEDRINTSKICGEYLLDFLKSPCNSNDKLKSESAEESVDDSNQRTSQESENEPKDESNEKDNSKNLEKDSR